MVELHTHTHKQGRTTQRGISVFAPDAPAHLTFLLLLPCVFHNITHIHTTGMCGGCSGATPQTPPWSHPLTAAAAMAQKQQQQQQLVVVVVVVVTHQQRLLQLWAAGSGGSCRFRCVLCWRVGVSAGERRGMTRHNDKCLAVDKRRCTWAIDKALSCPQAIQLSGLSLSASCNVAVAAASSTAASQLHTHPTGASCVFQPVAQGHA